MYCDCPLFHHLQMATTFFGSAAMPFPCNGIFLLIQGNSPRVFPMFTLNYASFPIPYFNFLYIGIIVYPMSTMTLWRNNCLTPIHQYWVRSECQFLGWWMHSTMSASHFCLGKILLYWSVDQYNNGSIKCKQSSLFKERWREDKCAFAVADYHCKAL